MMVVAHNNMDTKNVVVEELVEAIIPVQKRECGYDRTVAPPAAESLTILIAAVESLLLLLLFSLLENSIAVAVFSPIILLDCFFLIVTRQVDWRRIQMLVAFYGQQSVRTPSHERSDKSCACISNVKIVSP